MSAVRLFCLPSLHWLLMVLFWPVSVKKVAYCKTKIVSTDVIFKLSLIYSSKALIIRHVTSKF